MIAAFIPVRGGSKSIPHKNIKEIAGKPLVYWTVKAAADCEQIDLVYVATDDDLIADTVRSFGLNKVNVIGRSAESASDTASTESAMLEFADKYEFDDIVLIQATSPLLSTKDLNKGFELYAEETTDSVLSVVRQKRFVWRVSENGEASSVNYDHNKRPRRQEFDGYLVENGAFYITSKARLLESKNRLSGRIKALEMPEETYFEIDEPSDWIIIEHLLEKRENEVKTSDKVNAPNSNADGKRPDIKMVLMDCDGVLTDAGMYYSENGDELKKFNALDGMGIRLLRERGILVGIITGEDRELNKRRAEKIKVDIFVPGCKDKLSKVKEICKERGIVLSNVCYIGDDINDTNVIKSVGLGCSVPNGIDEVKKTAQYITTREGGSGAVREVVDMLISSGRI